MTALSETASVSRACTRAKIGRRTVYDWRETDADFAKAWDEALDLGSDALEDEAIRRAKDGTLKPVFYEGRKCGTIREYSDTLLIFMLKGRRPKFRDHIKLDAHVTGGVLCVGAAAATGQDWAKKYGRKVS